MAMDIMKLEDELLAMTINQLPAMYQVAVSRVNRKFTKLALKTTTGLDVRNIPHEHRLEVVKMMPKLVLIVGLKWKSLLDDSDEEESFVDSVAKINRNIVNVRQRLGMKNLVSTYLESAKESDAKFTGSHVRPPLEYEVYKKLTEKYPDLQIRCEMVTKDVNEYRGDKKCDLAVTNVGINSLKLLGDFSRKITTLLNRTINVTELSITMKPNEKGFKLFPVLDAIARLSLKRTYRCSSMSCN